MHFRFRLTRVDRLDAGADSESEDMFEMEMDKSATQPSAKPKDKHDAVKDAPVAAVSSTGPSFGAGYDLQYTAPSISTLATYVVHG
jgi:hypothetical protein